MFKLQDGREHFWQWDLDRKLIVEDNSISEVHFCNRTDDCSLVCETYVEDGITLVNVPNILLQNAWRIHVYAYDGNYTKHEDCYEVVARTKPADYAYTETEILNWNKINTKVTAAITDANTATTNATEATKAANTATTAANEATKAANTAANNASNASINASINADLATTAADETKKATLAAKSATDEATYATKTAIAAANEANSATSKINTAISAATAATEDANDATVATITATNAANIAATAANEATTNANTAATAANTAADEANTAASKINDKADKLKAIPHTDASGYPVILTDHLADETPIKCNIHGGKNLIPYPYVSSAGTQNGVTITIDSDGIITLNGTATATIYFGLLSSAVNSAEITKPGKYTISGMPGAVSGVSVQCHVDGAWGSAYVDSGNGATFTVASSIKYVTLQISKGAVCENVVIKPQLEEGSTATEYEPYGKIGDYDSTDLTYKIPIKCCGKNFIPYPYLETTKTVNGITFTDNGDGTITVNGTATAITDFILFSREGNNSLIVKAGATYTLSGTPSDGAYNKWYMYALGLSTEKSDMGNSVTFTGDDTDKRLSLVLRVASGVTAENVVFKPQLELGEAATEYEQYKTPSTVTASLATPLDIDEYIDIVSKKRHKGSSATDITVSGSLKMLDSGANVIMCGTSIQPSKIELSYYQDINKVITNLTNAILTQGGNV